jgi:excisionase family DNA binding protein
MTTTTTVPIQLLRKREVCERLGVSVRQLEVFIAQGKLRVCRFGRRCVRIDERELTRFVREEGREGMNRASPKNDQE